MLGDINPQSVRIAQNAVVYPGRNHVTTLTVKRYDGRNFKPVDLDDLTRVVLVFPDTSPTIVFDSLTDTVFDWAGNALSIDLSDYAMPESIQASHLIVFDAEHPQGQVLVDNIDSRIEFDFRLISTTGTLPPPTVEFITDAPQDGETYGRKDGAWVTLEALVSGVASVNGQSGVVVLSAADVGAATSAQGALADSAVQPGDLATVATSGSYTDLSDKPTLGTAAAANTVDFDPAGAAAGAISAHVAASDPHPQYQTQTEGDARYERGLVAGTNITIDRTDPAAPVISASGGGGGGGAVDSVNGQTGTVVLDATDVGADATGTAAAAVAAHVAAADPHTQYLTGTEADAAYAPISHVGAGGTAHANAVASGAAGFMTGADKAKLDGVSPGATANSTDATLLARANHTGTQPSSTISDFDSASRAQTEAELVAGTNVTITPSGVGATRQLTISAAGGGGSTNLSTTTSPTTLTVNSDTGTDAVLPAATGAVAGVLTAADKVKIDGVAAGATANNNTDSLPEGATNLYFTVARVLASALTGLSVLTGGPVVSTDSVLAAFGKLQAQINSLTTAVDGKQAQLVSGTNLKSINGNSLLGAGDLSVGGLTNPMTTEGDIIVAGAAGVPTRRAAAGAGTMLISQGIGMQPLYGYSPLLGGYYEIYQLMDDNNINVAVSNIKKKVISASTTFTISGTVSGRSSSFTLLIEGGNTHAVTWPASFKWLGGVPTLTAKDVITGFTIDNGTTWIVNYAGSYA